MQVTAINPTFHFRALWYQICQVGPTLLNAMTPEAITIVLIRASLIDEQNAELAAQQLLKLLGHDTAITGLVVQAMRDMDMSQITRFISHHNHHRLCAAEQGIPVAVTYKQ